AARVFAGGGVRRACSRAAAAYGARVRGRRRRAARVFAGGGGVRRACSRAAAAYGARVRGRRRRAGRVFASSEEGRVGETWWAGGWGSGVCSCDLWGGRVRGGRRAARVFAGGGGVRRACSRAAAACGARVRGRRRRTARVFAGGGGVRRACSRAAAACGARVR